ncbi:MAG TPA: hypothetical protein VMV94_14080, partial [Phycisphaerae bacterium]|nr:hypothetical protein [Phycisphaerae bacterium]
DDGDWVCAVSVLAAGKVADVRIDLASGKVLEVGGPHPNAPSSSSTWNFEKDAVDTVPPGWSVRQTKPTTALATWKVIADATAPSKPNVLALTHTENVDGTFNLAIAERSSFKDLDLSVQLKPVSGKEDQGGGPVWRCKDENNYYICRLNPLESNFRVYVVRDGVRKQLESVKVESVAGKWYAIRVGMSGKHIICYLDGKKMLEADDETFPDAGMVGLWTKADAASCFDDLTVSEVSEGKEPVASQPTAR